MAHDTGIIASFTDDANGVRADVVKNGSGIYRENEYYVILVIDTDADMEVGRVYRKRLDDAITYARRAAGDFTFGIAEY